MRADTNEYAENDEDDRVQAADQLSTVGLLARLCPDHAVHLLTKYKQKLLNIHVHS